MSRERGMTKRIFLWTCPRSCSSVFLRSIDTLSTTHALSEPFRFAFHFGPERQGRHYKSQPVDVTKSYEAVTKSILDQALNDGENVVFIKDMARYLKGRLTILEESFADAKHSFLIRNPLKVLKSQYKASINPEIQSGSDWTYFDPDDAGFKELFELYQFVKDKLDANPVIIDADDLLDSPNQMMKAYCDRVGIQYEDHMTTWKAGEVPQAFRWDGKCSCKQVWGPFDKTFKQRQFSNEDFHYLNVTRVGTFTSNDVFDCTFECLGNALCLSINVAASRGADGKLWCEMLSSDKYRDAENYARNVVSRHFSITSPCSFLPCRNGGTCIPNHKGNSYDCLCGKPYVGEYCEKVKEVKSCKEHYDVFMSNVSQLVTLHIGSGPTSVLCHMGDFGCGVGGWTPVMKIDGNKGTFHFNSHHWEDFGEYNLPGGETGFDELEAKLPTYWNTSFSKICLGMKIGQQLKFIVIDKTADSLYSLIADGQYRPTSLGRGTWKKLIGSQASLQLKCNKEGFNACCFRNQYSKARIGIIGSHFKQCSYCSSQIGFGTAGYPDLGNTCGNDASSRSDNGEKRIKAMGYILIQ